MKYVYFIAYNYNTKDGYGSGNAQVELNMPIKRFKDIEEIQNALEAKDVARTYVIINWKLIKGAAE